MAEDWLADVRKYAADADEKIVAAIVRYCGIALQKRDSSLVSFTDSKETDRVRENFLKKKLKLAHDDATLDAAIAAVGERMKGDRTKNRVTVYYLLTEHFGLLDIFAGAAGKAAGKAAGVAAGAAAGAALKGKTGTTRKKKEAPAAPLAAAGLGAAAATGSAAAPPPSEPLAAAAVPPPPSEPAVAAPPPPEAVAAVAPPPPSPAPVADVRPAAAYSAPEGGRDGGGGMGWLPWLLLGLLLLALILFGLSYCGKQDGVPAAGGDVAATSTGTPAPATPAAAPAAVPEGAGVIGAERDGKPMLTIYFDTGKSEVSNDLTASASGVQSYLAAHPGATLAVSGFNDPTGNAALNAELSKNRAQAVAKALEGLGIPAASIKLEKPADTTDASGDNSQSRRVEVVVKE